jgi:hypothetical protein
VTRDQRIVAAVAALRVTLGVGSILAPGKTARAFGFPDAQQTPMARLLGRWFGVREIVLATLALQGHGGPTPLVSDDGPLSAAQQQFVRLNIANDAVDAAAMLVPLIKREGVDRPQLIGVPVALAVSAGWLAILRGGS